MNKSETKRKIWIITSIAVILVLLLGVAIQVQSLMLYKDLAEYTTENEQGGEIDRLDPLTAGKSLYEQNNFKEAVAKLEQAVNEASTPLEEMRAMYLLSQAYFGAEQPFEAIRILKKLVGTESYQHVDIIYIQDSYRALIAYSAMGRNDDYYNEVFRGDPKLFFGLIAEEDAWPTQKDATIRNLKDYARNNYSVNID